MLGERYMEVRYEALVADPVAEMARLAAFLGLEGSGLEGELVEVRTQSVGKWRTQPARHLAEIRAVIEPTLGAFGYDWHDGPSLGDKIGRVLDRTSRFFAGRKFFRGEGVSVRSRAEPGGLGGLFRVRTSGCPDLPTPAIWLANRAGERPN
jgi:hypothetical protein